MKEKKEIVLDFFKKNPNIRLSISQLNKELGNISYPTTLKWVLVLTAEKILKLEDFGNLKIISCNST